YVFSGWYSDNSYTVLYQPAVLTQDIALYGKYDAIQYLIRFFDGNNQVLSADYLTWNDEINYPDGPDKASTDTFDFVFSHWSTTQKYVNSNLDIYPVYDKIFKPESVTLSLSVDTIYLNQTYQEVSIILKDLSLSVTIESDLNTHETGKYEIRYLIYDGDDLIYTMKRYVRVIDPPQVISISLNPGISTILVGGTYYEAGATSSIGNVVVSGTVDTSIAGTYYVTYEVTYSDQIYSITRVVTVIDPNTGMTDILSYVIYKEEENA
ncbi:MAG TPA: hypothetical protein PK113_04270, partial [Bacillota bacterium]|nr:hypothetical protein [Bacillota bacterium]